MADLPAGEWVVADDAGVGVTHPPSLTLSRHTPPFILSLAPYRSLPPCQVDKERLVLPKPELPAFEPPAIKVEAPKLEGFKPPPALEVSEEAQLDVALSGAAMQSKRVPTALPSCGVHGRMYAVLCFSAPAAHCATSLPCAHPVSAEFGRLSLQGKKFELPKFEGFKAPRITLPEVKAPQVRRACVKNQRVCGAAAVAHVIGGCNLRILCTRAPLDHLLSYLRAVLAGLSHVPCLSSSSSPFLPPD